MPGHWRQSAGHASATDILSIIVALYEIPKSAETEWLPCKEAADADMHGTWQWFPWPYRRRRNATHNMGQISNAWTLLNAWVKVGTGGRDGEDVGTGASGRVGGRVGRAGSAPSSS